MSGSKLNPVALGLSLGVLWGVSLFLLGLIAYFYTYGHPFVSAVGTLYLGYEPTLIGSVLGGIIGFFDAFITGLLIAWLYNQFNHCCSTTCCATKNKEDTCCHQEDKTK